MHVCYTVLLLSTGSYIQQPAYNQVGSPQNSIGSPQMQLGSPYSAISSPESQIYSPQNAQHFNQMPPTSAQMVLPPHNQLGSPPYASHSPSPYQTTIRSPGQYSGCSSDSIPTTSAPYVVQYPPHTTALEDVEGIPHLIPYSSAPSSCAGVPAVFESMVQEPAVYSIPGQQHMAVLETYSMGPHQLPPFAHVFESGLHPEARIPEKHSPPDFSDSAAVPIKQIPNEYGLGPIEFYHPPSPQTPEGMMCHAEMCGGPPLDMCGPLPPPLPNHLCPVPTLVNSGRRSKSHKHTHTPSTVNKAHTVCPGVYTCIYNTRWLILPHCL